MVLIENSKRRSLRNARRPCWGYNREGRLGNGGTTDSALPAPVSGLREVKAVSVGADHSLALLRNGTVMAWGFNGGGRAGQRHHNEQQRARAVTGLPEQVVAISAGSGHSLALLRNGTVMAWGENESGQLGDGTTANKLIPVAIPGLEGVRAVSAGGGFSLRAAEQRNRHGVGRKQPRTARRRQHCQQRHTHSSPRARSHHLDIGGLQLQSRGSRRGQSLAVGDNASGQLGDGTTEDRHEPLEVQGPNKVVQASAGRNFS